MIRQATTKALFDYWNAVRQGRLAPRRFEIEPAKIAGLLPETFILERADRTAYRFRLAGTRLCQLFGQELRGTDFLDLWSGKDRDAMLALIRDVFKDGLVGRGYFVGYREGNEITRYEFCLLPLVHNGFAIDRLLGAITAIGRPRAHDEDPLLGQNFLETEVVRLDFHKPDTQDPSPLAADTDPDNVVRLGRRRLRLVEGGLNGSD